MQTIGKSEKSEGRSRMIQFLVWIVSDLNRFLVIFGALFLLACVIDTGAEEMFDGFWLGMILVGTGGAVVSAFLNVLINGASRGAMNTYPAVTFSAVMAIASLFLLDNHVTKKMAAGEWGRGNGD